MKLNRRSFLAMAGIVAVTGIVGASAEHKGRLYCEAHHEQRYLAPGETFTLHVETGLLDDAGN